RSNSSMPVEKRGTSAASISDSLRTTADVASGWKRRAADEPESATVSTSVFQALHCGHWPAQRGVVPPHSVHVYTVLVLAIYTASAVVNVATEVGTRGASA